MNVVTFFSPLAMTTGELYKDYGMHSYNKLFSNVDRIALAVSGGADSIAMLYMLHEWAKEKGKKLIILTVNHNLRPEALQECEYVKKCANDLGLQHVLLNWNHSGVSSNVHDKARKARYSLMTKWCKVNEVGVLCTAHHMDDRVENFFIRVFRGSGILGLIDNQEIIYEGIRVIRPLFDLSKSELITYLKERKIKWFEDKSNYDDKYLRTSIRRWIALLPEELDADLFKNRVIGVKDNLLRTSKLINRIFEKELEFKVKIHDDKTVLTELPEDEEIAYMILSYIITLIGGRKAARLNSIEMLYKKLLSGKLAKWTLGGCIIEHKGKNIIFYKETGKQSHISKKNI